jgi:hypothetical protein
LNTKVFLFQNKVIYVQKDNKYKWIISNSSLSTIFEVDTKNITFFTEKEKVKQNIDYIYLNIPSFPENEVKEALFWSRRGAIKVAYLLQTEMALEILDFLEEIEFRDEENAIDDVEDILNTKLADIKSGNSLKEINEYIDVLTKFLKDKEFLKTKREGGIKNFILELFDDAIKQTLKDKGN